MSTPGDVLWALTDHENTVRDLAAYDAGTGHTTIAEHRVFNAFGVQTSAAAVDCIFGYTGRPFDAATGEQNNLNRWYEAITGKWLSEDPVEADINLYRYCGNSSENATDPAGLYTPDPNNPADEGWTGTDPTGQYTPQNAPTDYTAYGPNKRFWTKKGEERRTFEVEHIYQTVDGKCTLTTEWGHEYRALAEIIYQQTYIRRDPALLALQQQQAWYNNEANRQARLAYRYGILSDKYWKTSATLAGLAAIAWASGPEAYAAALILSEESAAAAAAASEFGRRQTEAGFASTTAQSAANALTPQIMDPHWGFQFWSHWYGRHLAWSQWVYTGTTWTDEKVSDCPCKVEGSQNQPYGL